MVMKELFVT